MYNTYSNYTYKTRKLNLSVQLVQTRKTMGKRVKTESHERKPNWTAFRKGLNTPVDKSEIGKEMMKKNEVN